MEQESISSQLENGACLLWNVKTTVWELRRVTATLHLPSEKVTQNPHSWQSLVKFQFMRLGRHLWNFSYQIMNTTKFAHAGSSKLIQAPHQNVPDLEGVDGIFLKYHIQSLRLFVPVQHCSFRGITFPCPLCKNSVTTTLETHEN